jgi:hypothetical protein
MSELVSKVGIKSTMHLVLKGPDGKIKDERKPREPQLKQEVRDETKG